MEGIEDSSSKYLSWSCRAQDQDKLCIWYLNKLDVWYHGHAYLPETNEAVCTGSKKKKKIESTVSCPKFEAIQSFAFQMLKMLYGWQQVIQKKWLQIQG